MPPRKAAKNQADRTNRIRSPLKRQQSASSSDDMVSLKGSDVEIEELQSQLS